MKNIKHLLIVALSAALWSCQEEPEVLAPKITLGEDKVELSSSGEAVSITYLVENAIEGEKIAVENTAEWLNISTSKVRAIEFSASENTSSDVREATVTISYKGAESVTVAVSQACYDTPLRLEILDITAADLYFSVFTTNPELTWIPMVSSKAYFDSQRSEATLFEDNLEYFAYLAEIRDVTLEEYLTEVLATGTIENILFEGLEPSTEYVVYAYGITPKGVRTTDVVWEAFTTEAPWDGDLTFEFNVMEEHHTLFFDVTPSHTGVPYYFGIAEKKDIEEWMDYYGTTDLREAIQKGEIDANIEVLIAYEFISSREDFFPIFNQTGRMFDEQMPCNGSTDYVLFAVKWDEHCNLIGEVSTYEYTSLPVPPSDNQLTLEVTNITKSSADATVTASNDDTYVILPLKSSDIEGMNDEVLFEYLMANYDYLLSEYTYSGNKTRTFRSLEPNVNYTFVCFGYLAGVKTTDYILRESFSTGRSNDPNDCTFEFEWTVDTEEAWVKVTPSDDGHHYYWNIFDSRYDAQGVKDYIKNVIIDDWYEGDFAAFASWRLDQGETSESIPGLYPDTEYRVAVVIMDYQTGEFLSDVTFSESFRTKAIEYANLEVSVDFEPYFDIQDLVNAGYRDYREYLQYGDALLPATINIQGDYSAYFYTIYGGDLSDTEAYPDSIFVEYLPQDGCYLDSALFTLTYNEDDPYGTPEIYTMCAIAYDHDGRYSHIYRRPFACMNGGGSSPDIFFDPTKVAPARSSAEVNMNLSVGKRALRNESSITTPEVATFSAEVDPTLAEMNRKVKAERVFARRNEIVSENYVIPTK